MTLRVGWDTALTHAVGGKAADKLGKLGLRTVGDLLEYRPRRYIETSLLSQLSGLEVGDHVTVVAEVRTASSRSYGAPHGRGRGGRTGGQLLSVVVGDDAGSRLLLTFFNQPWREKELVEGCRAVFSGKIAEFRGERQLNSPDYQILGGPGPMPVSRGSTPKTRLLQEAARVAQAQGNTLSESDLLSRYVRGLIPVYRLARGVHYWHLSDSVSHVLDVVDELPDPVPADVRERHRLPDLGETYRLLHLPQDWSDVGRSRRRFAWNEAFTLQTELARRRRSALSRTTRPRVSADSGGPGLVRALEQRLPFALTQGQRAVVDEILADLARPHPMLRLLQGEVGSGKTVVALLAMLTVVDAGGQAALLAPTEVLAVQHARTLEELLGELAMAGQLGGGTGGTRIALLTGSMGAPARRAALLDAASGAAGIVVGTHALLQEHVQFADLGLVVVDEQHRFGVEQRDALRMKAEDPPHVLVMTATPIPRTVAMTVFGDLETSVLRELPTGRAPVSTSVVPAAEKPAWYARAWQRVREEVSAGRQAYVVCPRIGDGAEGDGAEGEVRDVAGDWPDDDGAPRRGSRPGRPGAQASPQPQPQRPLRSVLETAEELASGQLLGLRVGMLHGRMPPEAKDTVMRDFARGGIDVLVATTVIEVGIDVPNATVMVVLDAERFGASQLHQLRGRVGRGEHAGLCLLVTHAVGMTPARERLDRVAATTDGFEVARVDLEQRREGDVLGVVQSGRSSHLRALSLLRDEDLIVAARREAREIVSADPGLVDHPHLAAAVAEMLGEERGAFLEKA